MTELSDLLNTAKAKGISVSDALKRIEEAGLKADRGQLYKALKGDHATNVTDAVLQAWAVGFKLDVRKLRKAQGVPVGEREPFQPHPSANQMNRGQRKAVNDIIRLLVESSSAGAERDITGPEDAGDVSDLGAPDAESQPS